MAREAKAGEAEVQQVGGVSASAFENSRGEGGKGREGGKRTNKGMFLPVLLRTTVVKEAKVGEAEVQQVGRVSASAFENSCGEGSKGVGSGGGTSRGMFPPALVKTAVADGRGGARRLRIAGSRGI